MPPIGSLLGWLDDKKHRLLVYCFLFWSRTWLNFRTCSTKIYHKSFLDYISCDNNTRYCHVQVNRGKDIASQKYCIGIAGIHIALWTYETSKWMTQKKWIQMKLSRYLKFQFPIISYVCFREELHNIYNHNIFVYHEEGKWTLFYNRTK